MKTLYFAEILIMGRWDDGILVQVLKLQHGRLRTCWRQAARAASAPTLPAPTLHSGDAHPRPAGGSQLTAELGWVSVFGPWQHGDCLLGKATAPSGGKPWHLAQIPAVDSEAGSLLRGQFRVSELQAICFSEGSCQGMAISRTNVGERRKKPTRAASIFPACWECSLSYLLIQ